jgi:DNA-binding GntR family transcriptional regulator
VLPERRTEEDEARWADAMEEWRAEAAEAEYEAMLAADERWHRWWDRSSGGALGGR